MAFTAQGIETVRAEESWQLWSAPTVDTTSLDSIKQTTYFRLDRADSPSEIFSYRSTLGTQITSQTNDSIHQVSPEIQPWQTSIFLMIVLCYYIYVIFHHWNILPAIMRSVSSVAKSISLYDSSNNAESRLSIHSGILVILILTTLTASQLSSEVRQSPMLYLGMIMAAIALLFAYKYILISIISRFGSDGNSFSDLSKINTHSLTVLAVVYTPIAITTSIDPSDNHAALLILLGLWVFHCLRLFKLFITSGFGKLQWILYLCAVEMLPVSYLITIAVRH